MSVASLLDFADGPIPISYSGGLFQIEDLITKPMKKEIESKIDAVFLPPKLSPCAGAVLLATLKYLPAAVEQVKKGLLQHEQ
ncbi:hypothetical protein AGMMS49983_06810 [Clostridia bacterium]|nr:hypothetical protein AGMMS49983_06810 [Clostridia bacterium]